MVCMPLLIQKSFGQDNAGGLNDAGDGGGMGNDACFSCGETG